MLEVVVVSLWTWRRCNRRRSRSRITSHRRDSRKWIADSEGSDKNHIEKRQLVVSCGAEVSLGLSLEFEKCPECCLIAHWLWMVISELKSVCGQKVRTSNRVCEFDFCWKLVPWAERKSQVQIKFQSLLCSARSLCLLSLRQSPEQFSPSKKVSLSLSSSSSSSFSLSPLSMFHWSSSFTCLSPLMAVVSVVFVLCLLGPTGHVFATQAGMYHLYEKKLKCKVKHLTVVTV